MVKIKTQVEALAHLKAVLGSTSRLKVKSSLGYGYGCELDGESCLVMFKKEYYRCFKYHFPEVKKADGKSYGWAQVMNKHLLVQACAKGVVWIIFIVPDGSIYKCAAQLFRKFAKLRNTEVPHLKGEVAMPLDFFESIKGV